ncbi:glycosyltransferase family 4 protein [Candidatus Bathyarchaeota archaeon]|nr:glycosyltransferase family 4 protein [Candidatus Bathyarchaeota archaeon]
MVKELDTGLRSSAFTWNLWYETKTLSYMLVKRLRDQRFVTLPEARADLIYCSQQLLFAKLPWIVDVEYANELAGGNEIRVVRRIAQKCLASEHCKKIIPWSDWAKRTLYRTMNCKSFKEKIETVHFGVRPKNFVKKKENGKLRLLFVGSINLSNALNFEGKGGVEVTEAFVELSKRYGGMELVVRSWVPPDLKRKYANNPNITILDSPIGEDELTALYASSDICIFPAHLNVGMAILEAMSYELPVIARAVFDVSEAIIDMKTGILLDPPPNIRYYLWNGAPNYDRNFLLGIRKNRSWLVKQIVEKTSLLIEDASLRRRLGREARRSIEEGKFSIKNRNEKLKRIFDEAVNAN